MFVTNSNTACTFSWPNGTPLYHYIIYFKNFSYLQEDILVQCVSKILQASKIVRDLFVIKLSTFKGVVCLLIFQ
jgi:hypothetical protein